MNWEEVCEHPSLKDLPFKIELNEYGQIVMSPVKLVHSAFQGEIVYLLRSMMNAGTALVECAVKTKKGTKVADVAWLSEKRYKQNRYKTECEIAPEICVEVLSESNTKKEMKEKQRLYFEQGSQEVWLCKENGDIAFYDPKGLLEKSHLVPTFPTHIDI